MREAVGVVIGVEESVRRVARVREQRVERLVLDLGIAGDRTRVADKIRDFVARSIRAVTSGTADGVSGWGTVSA